MDAWETKIIAVVQEKLDAEDGLALMQTQDWQWGWQGMQYAMRGLPIAACWNEVQRQSYNAWLNDAPWGGDFSDVLPAEMREDWVGV